MRLTRCYPTMTNLDLLNDYFKQNRPAMFVANHCSWMDIPFLGATIGWRNYKLISKSELGAVPILGTAIQAGGHIMVDRTDRKSQLRTLKQGIQYLKVRRRLGEWKCEYVRLRVSGPAAGRRPLQLVLRTPSDIVCRLVCRMEFTCVRSQRGHDLGQAVC
jgi:Acyltransferase